jgi:hypothetical protein
MYVSLDEACTHVDAAAFRLVAGVYNRQGTRLLATAVSPPPPGCATFLPATPLHTTDAVATGPAAPLYSVRGHPAARLDPAARAPQQREGRIALGPQCFCFQYLSPTH